MRRATQTTWERTTTPRPPSRWTCQSGRVPHHHRNLSPETGNLSVRPCRYLSAGIFVCLSVCLSVYLSVCLPVSLPLAVSVCLYHCLSLCLCLPVNTPVGFHFTCFFMAVKGMDITCVVCGCSGIIVNCTLWLYVSITSWLFVCLFSFAVVTRLCMSPVLL